MIDDAIDQEAVAEIFFPYATQELARIRADGVRFVHYTSAEAGLSIVRNGELWMRNALLMNDFSEIEHGRACLQQAWANEAIGGRLKKLLESIHAGIVVEVERRFDERDNFNRRETYLLSISEHRNDEDRLGRLSMWRAYGGKAGVAFVFNNDAFSSESSALDAYVTPVLYADAEKFAVNFAEFVDNVERHLETVRTMDVEVLTQCLVAALTFAVLSTKHPGFEEEREWRAIFAPVKLDGELADTSRILPDIQCIRGVPQRIYKVPFKNYPDEGFTGATLPEILNRLIIGPTAHAFPIASALDHALRIANVPDAGLRIFMSGIPLRE